MAGELCSTACGYCGMCTAAWEKVRETCARCGAELDDDGRCPKECDCEFCGSVVCDGDCHERYEALRDEAEEFHADDLVEVE